MRTLVDSSAWIDFFRGERAAVRRVDALLADGDAALCGPVLAEVLSGATSRGAYDGLRDLLNALPTLQPSPEVWGKVAETRFGLARAGRQVAILDLLIAWTAVDSGVPLLTRDRDFRVLADRIPLELELL